MQGQPDWSRLSVVPVTSERILLIDRENGRWGYVPADNQPLVQLLSVEGSRLPDAVRLKRDTLAGDLLDLGLGRVEYSTPPDLNTVILKLTKACNYACAYCYDLEPDDKIQHLPLEAAVQVMREALELTPERLGIILHGGEPTLLYDKLIKPIVLEGERLADSMVKKIDFRGQTNLHRLTRDMVEFFTEHRVRWGISLDGPPEFNDKFRVLHDGTGTYDRFARALEEYPDFVRRNCAILSTITANNDRHLLTIARHFRDLGMASWNWSLFQPIGQGRGKESIFSFSIERLLDSWNELFDAVEDGEFDGMRIGPVSLYLENFLRGPGGNMCMKKDCGAGRDLLSVSSDGTIHACDCIDMKGPYANLGLLQIGGDRSLENARSSDRAKLIRSRDVTVGQCRTCPWLAVCGGTCMAHAHELNGIWGDQCEIAMMAFSRIATSLGEGDALRRYWDSLSTIKST
jgi:uncharacterized protein